MQGRHVIFSWTLFFSLVLALATVPTALLIKAIPAQELALITLFTFLSSALFFAIMAWFVVITINRSARLIQEQKRLEGLKR
jgi:hypothetical protein